jgi:hypothetical protein
MIKVVVALFLGIGLYGFLSYYQPMAESYYKVEASSGQQSVLFASPIPFDLVLSPNSQ